MSLGRGSVPSKHVLHGPTILLLRGEGGGWIKKIAFIFSSDFKTMFTKHFPSEILNLSFEKKTVYLNYNFSDSMVRYSYTRKDTMMSSR